MLDLGLDHKQLFGRDSFKAPFNLVAQNQGDNLTSFVGFSDYIYFPFDVNLDKNHILFVGEIVVRPHYAVATDRYGGIGLEGIYVDSDKEMMVDGDELMVDNMGHFDKSLNMRTATEHAKDNMNLRMLYGVYAAHIPCWFVMQGGEGGVVGVVGASKSSKLMYGTSKMHTIIKGDAIFRPHVAYASDAALGDGINCLATGGLFKIKEHGELIYLNEQIAMQKLARNKA